MHRDVIVVGAGPAGACAAWTLARAGARVAIVDPSHPREKPCGGGVTGRAIALAGGMVDGGSFPAAVISSARFSHESGGDPVAVELDARGVSAASSLIVASRRDFDAALLQAACDAGAELHAARVIDVRAERRGVRVETSDGGRDAGFLIGADGANSLVRRRLAAPFSRRQLSIATGFYAHDVTSREVSIEMVGNPPGYIWSFPRTTHLAIGICAQADAGVGAAALRARAADWIERTQIARGARLTPYSWPIPSLSPADFGCLTLAGERWCLAGDAAGLVDPITREGIFFAMQSGIFAAHAAHAANPADAYRTRVNDEIAPELACAARLKEGFFRPQFSRLLMHALRRSGAVRRVMADLVAGRQPYSTLKWRLFRTLEFGLFWRWVHAAARAETAPPYRE